MLNITQSPASPANYTVGRGGNKPELIVCHVTDGVFAGSVAWFQNPTSNVSAHYVISMAGQIVQMVQESDTAYQSGVWSINQRSIGIEHEGQPSKGPWAPTDVQLQASAQLVAAICQRWGIAPSRQTIQPHSNFNPRHNCPGPTWPWDRYLAMVGEAMPPASAHQPDPSQQQAVTLYDPATNQPVGTGTLIVGSSKVYVRPKS